MFLKHPNLNFSIRPKKTLKKLRNLKKWRRLTRNLPNRNGSWSYFNSNRPPRRRLPPKKVKPHFFILLSPRKFFYFLTYNERKTVTVRHSALVPFFTKGAQKKTQNHKDNPCKFSWSTVNYTTNHRHSFSSFFFGTFPFSPRVQRSKESSCHFLMFSLKKSNPLLFISAYAYFNCFIF